MPRYRVLWSNWKVSSIQPGQETFSMSQNTISILSFFLAYDVENLVFFPILLVFTKSLQLSWMFSFYTGGQMSILESVTRLTLLTRLWARLWEGQQVGNDYPVLLKPTCAFM